MTDKTKSKKDAAAETMTFEAALDRLEAIVREMETGALNLDDMGSRFEEGTKLITLCSTRLNEVERKIELLIQKDGQTVAVPFPATSPGGETET